MSAIHAEIARSLKNIENRLKSLPSTSFEYIEPNDLPTRRRSCASIGRQCPEDHRHRAGGAAGCRHAANPGGSGGGRRPDQMASTLTIMPYMMDPGEDRIIADAIMRG